MTPAEQGQTSVGLIGHSGAVSLLDRSLKSGRLSHAYLFVGPRNVGKRAVALYLARAVNCQGEGKRPCDSCSQCRRIASGHHADVHIVEITDGGETGQATTRIGIERIREIRSQASLHPYEGSYRVFIIDGAEHLSHEAANSLLKTLEEPPPKVLLLLLTAAEGSVLPTILSRCQRIELQTVPSQELAGALTAQYSLGEEKAQLIARLSQGCPGWAILAIQDDQVLENRIQRLDRLIGLADLDIEERFNHAAELAPIFMRDRQAGQEVLSQWLSWWRDLLLARGGAEESITNAHRRRELEEQSRRYPYSSIQDFIHRLMGARSHIERNVNVRLVLELLMLKLPLAPDIKESAGHQSLEM